MGFSTVPSHNVTLAEHWNGAKWSVQPTPTEGSYPTYLSSVSASSSTNAWSVGNYYDGAKDQPFAVQCC